MKIAVTYEQGEIFQHFGRTETFKVYEVEDGKVVRSEVIGSGGTGHGALAGLLSGQGVDVLICGGIGGGAQAALESCGIELCAGASGSADEAVEAYLRGELVNTGSNCDHHHGEGHECGHHEDACGHHGEGNECGHHGEEGCGHHEAGCGEHEDGHGCGEDGGCCGGSAAGDGSDEQVQAIRGRNVGKTCLVHYRGTLDDGTQFDSSYDRGEPLEFTCGIGQMIRGFDAAVADMEVGQVVDVRLTPDEAYGERDPRAVFTVRIEQMPGAEDLEAGQNVYLQDPSGRPFPVTVAAKDAETVTFDANHRMAGKALNFRIELVEVC